MRTSVGWVPEPNTGCWLWLGEVGPNGYPHKAAHRRALAEKLGRPIGPRLCALHSCDVRSCVNPDHLYEGTYRDNARDRTARGRHPYIRKTHCKSGHPFDEANTRRFGNSRQCRACNRVSAAKSRQAKDGGMISIRKCADCAALTAKLTDAERALAGAQVFIEGRALAMEEMRTRAEAAEEQVALDQRAVHELQDLLDDARRERDDARLAADSLAVAVQQWKDRLFGRQVIGFNELVYVTAKGQERIEDIIKGRDLAEQDAARAWEALKEIDAAQRAAIEPMHVLADFSPANLRGDVVQAVDCFIRIEKVARAALAAHEARVRGGGRG